MSFYTDYIQPAWEWAKDTYGAIEEGWDVGDYDNVSTFYDQNSWAFKAGDYLEDAWSIGSTIYKGAKAAGFLGSDEQGRPLPTPGKVSGQSSNNVGSFTASETDFSKTGWSEPRVQAGLQRSARSQIPSIAATVNRVGLTTRSGKRTIALPTSSISVRNTTRRA